jgi:hypothetical protein
MKNYFALTAPVIYSQPWVNDKLVSKRNQTTKSAKNFALPLRKSHSIRACGILQAG